MHEEYVKTKLKELGKALRELRMQRNLTQQELARLAQIDSSNLQKIEGGKNMTMDTILRICIALEIAEGEPFNNAWNKNNNIKIYRQAR